MPLPITTQILLAPVLKIPTQSHKPVRSLQAAQEPLLTLV